MTDPDVADVVYLEPLTVDAVERSSSASGRTACSPASAARRRSTSPSRSRAPACSTSSTCRLLGTPLEAIEMAEDRERFRDLLDRIGQPYAPS